MKHRVITDQKKCIEFLLTECPEFDKYIRPRTEKDSACCAFCNCNGTAPNAPAGRWFIADRQVRPVEQWNIIVLEGSYSECMRAFTKFCRAMNGEPVDSNKPLDMRYNEIESQVPSRN